jgi:hypothetical protein
LTVRTRKLGARDIAIVKSGKLPEACETSARRSLQKRDAFIA